MSDDIILDQMRSIARFGAEQLKTIIDCPRCKRGSVTVHDGPSWWQVRKLRCAYCRGTGRVYKDSI